LNFIKRFTKNAVILNSIKIRPVGDELFHVDGRPARRTNRLDEADNCFLQFFERT